MGLFSALSAAIPSSRGLCYTGTDPYVREIVCFSEVFLTAAGKSRPTSEERFNAILSLTAVIFGYSCHESVHLKDFDIGAIAAEIRKLLGKLSVNPELIAQNEVELDNLQHSLDLKHKKCRTYSGDIVSNILMRSRFDQFVYGSQHANFSDIQCHARDYSPIMIRAYRQDQSTVWHLGVIFNSFILAVLAGHRF
jgi:hypothetical protein